MDVQGHCDERFSSVGDEFERNLTQRGDLGASVSVTVDGETVVDLWGGWATAARGRAWDKDTLCVIMSCSKGLTALCAHLLATTGALDFDEPVCVYWPEFAAAGKERVLVRHLLTHQAGLPVLREPVTPGGFYDWDYMVDRLAAEAPLWEPGTAYGYHALTFGFLVGEVIRRVSGRPIGEFFATEVARPLGLDLWLGLPDAEHHRVAEFLPPSPPGPDAPVAPYTALAMTDPSSVPWLVMQNNGGYLIPGEWDSPAALSAVLPSSGAVGNARSLAGVYRAVLDGRIGRFSLDAEDLNQMAAVQSAILADRVLLGPGRWTMGFHKGGRTPKGAQPPVRISLSEDAFGHSGFGGSIGIADAPAGMSFAYVMNQMAADMGLGPTGQSLVDAVYRTLGYRRARYDTWVR